MNGKMFVIFDKKSDYTNQISSIEARDIVFIKDTREVITHGVTFTDQATIDATLASIQTALAGKLSSITAGDKSISISGTGTTRTIIANIKPGGGLAKDATYGLYVDTGTIATKSSVDTVSSNLTDLQNNTYRKSETYTQKEVNDRIATVSGSVYRVAGSVDNFTDLPSTGDATVGDVYNIVNAFTFEGKPYPAGTNVVLASHLEGGQTLVDWDPLGGTVDLSGYVPTSRTINGSPLSANVTLTGASIKLTGYTVASTYTSVAATDTINVAIGKLQKGVSDVIARIDAHGNYTINGYKISTSPTLIGSDLLLTGLSVPTTYSPVAATDNITTAIGKIQRYIFSISSIKINGKAINTNPTLNGADILLTGYTTATTYTAVSATDSTNVAIGKLQKGITDQIANLTTTQNYTVNSKKINTNPVLTGADIKLTGYTAVTGGKLAATDTINAAMNKLDTAVTALDWEVITAS